MLIEMGNVTVDVVILWAGDPELKLIRVLGCAEYAHALLFFTLDCGCDVSNCYTFLLP